MRTVLPPGVLAPVCLVLGALALVWAALAYRSQRRFLGRSVRTNAVIQSIRVETLDRGKARMYFPIIKFTTAAGNEVTTECNTTQGGIRVGQLLTVLHDPNDPTKVEIDSFWSHWAMVTIALSLAVLLLISACGALVAIYASSR